MTNIVVLIVILALAVLVFLKMSMIQAMMTIVVALVSSFVAFGYYEMLGGLLASYVGSLALWSQVISFMLLFVLTFAVLQTGVVTLLKGEIHLGTLPERIGRPIFGMVLGWIVAGVVLTAVWLSPLAPNLPYARFDGSRPNPEEPQGVLLNADGMVAGWFGLVSQGSLCAINKPASFAVVRAGFLDQLSLNRIADKMKRHTSEQALIVPQKNGVWNMPDLVDVEGQAVSAPSGHQLMAVRLGIRRKALKDSSPFALGQVSVVCKADGSADNPVGGTGVAIYPVGYLVSDRLQRKSLTEKVEISSNNPNETQQWIDFVFFVPRNTEPVLGRFKLNNAATLSAPVEMDQAPEPSNFGANVTPKTTDSSND